MLCSILPGANLNIDSSELSFGVQTNEHQVVCGHFNIINSGDLEGSFDLKHPLPSNLSLSPSVGKLAPNQSQKIQVKILCNKSGEVDEFIRLVFIQ